MTGEALHQLKKLRQNYLLLKMTELALFSIAVGLLMLTLLHFTLVATTIRWAAAILSIVVSFVSLFFLLRLHRLDNKRLTPYLNARYPQLQESLDLILRPQIELTSLQQLQQLKTAELFATDAASMRFPNHIRAAISVLVVCAAAFLGSSAVPILNHADTPVSHETQTAIGDTTKVHIKAVTCTVAPPAYTGFKERTTTNKNLTVEEGSIVSWNVEFKGEPKSAKVIFSGKDSVSLMNAVVHKTFLESGFYQFEWSDRNNTYHSEFYQLQVTTDQHPKAEIKNLQQFTKVAYANIRPIEIQAAFQDDYGLSDAVLVATVAKGSGESVKFREEKLKFSSPETVVGKNIAGLRTIDLKKLGMEPGDEIYFYAQVWDNKTPVAQHSRTETFFIAIQDTARDAAVADSGLGVDLMPEYFRSQRQIIIDTEKLLRDKKRISKFQFKSTSNELGYDQKVLRLRYGQFLGDEDEAGIGEEAVQPQQEEETDVTKQYGHQHDTKNEHNLVEQKKDDHAHELKDPDAKEDPVKAFAHNHDNTEVATFFVQSLKAKLKAAITLMWDAELYLRLYQPEKSLPYQYKALDLLKEISNDSRVYVHRTGFDPPPLKEEKRLTGDLSEAKVAANHHLIDETETHPAIRAALPLIENLLLQNGRVSSQQETLLNKAGLELSAEALRAPVVYLKSLSLLRSLSNNQLKPEDATQALTEIRKSFWRILERQPSSPSREVRASTKMDQLFLEKLQSGRNE